MVDVKNRAARQLYRVFNEAPRTHPSLISYWNIFKNTIIRKIAPEQEMERILRKLRLLCL